MVDPLKQPKLYPSLFLGKNEGYISFGAGQPDLPPPKEVYDDLHLYNSFQYGLIRGEQKLREKVAIAHKVQPDDVFITNGASEALQLSLYACQGKSVLLTKPYYYSYPPLVEFAKKQPVYTNLVQGKINYDNVEKKLQNKEADAILINSPANPTGCVETPTTLKKIESLTHDLNIPFIFDEVYSDLIYQGEHYSPRKENVICIHSFSKTFSLCGVRVGYLYTKNAELLQQMADWKTHTSMNTSLYSQAMALNTFKVPPSYIKKQLTIWQERRNHMAEGLEKIGLDFWSPEGAFYVMPKVPNPTKFAEDMFFKHKLICYLGEWFGAPQRVRFSYATTVENIEKGLKIVEKYLATK